MYIGGPSPQALRARVEQHGFSAIEIAMPIDPNPLSTQFADGVRACSSELGLPVALHEALPLAAANGHADMAARLRARLDQTLDLAIEARCRVVTLHTTSTRTIRPMLPGWQREDTRWFAHEMDHNVTRDIGEARRVYVDLLRAMGPRATDGGVTLAVENNFRDVRHFGERFDSVADVIGLVDAAAVPGVGLCLDVYKAASTETSIPAAIRDWGPMLANVHVSDYTPTDTTIGQHRLAVGRGQIDWRAVLAALTDVGYDGPVTLEMLASDEDLAASVRYLTRLDPALLPARG